MKYWSIVIFTIILGSCNTSKLVYNTKGVSKESLKIKAYTLSHCGCTIYQAIQGPKDHEKFILTYENSILTKQVFHYDANNIQTSSTSLIGVTENPLIPCDSMDLLILKKIKSHNESEESVYELNWVNYTGYKTRL